MPCTKEFVLFSDTSDGKFANITISKKIKFTHIDSNQSQNFKNYFTKLKQIFDMSHYNLLPITKK